MQNNKIYQAHIPDLDNSVKSDKYTVNYLASDKDKARNKVENNWNDNLNFDSVEISISPKYEKLKDLFSDYNILTVTKKGRHVELKVENNRRKKGYDIFIVTFTNQLDVKSVLRVQDLSKSYKYLTNGQPSKNVEYYEL